MNGLVLRNGARRVVLELAAVGLLVGLPIDFPADFTTAGAAWTFVLGHPTFLLHALVGTVVLAEAVALVVRSAATPGAGVIIGAVGLGSVLLAFGAGAMYVSDGQQGSSLTLMTAGWVGAVAAYATGWIVGRRALARGGTPVAR